MALISVYLFFMWYFGSLFQVDTGSERSCALYGRFAPGVPACKHSPCTCEGANTEVHSRLHESWDSEDGVKRTDWAGFFPAAGGAAPRGPVAYNMLVPRRETGTDWKHKPGHPDQSHPRGRRAASLFHDRGGGWTLELHTIRSQHICILIHRSWWQKAFSHRTGTKSKQTQRLSHLRDWVLLLKPAALCMCSEMQWMAAAAGTLGRPAGDITKLRNTLRIQLRQRRGRVRGRRVQKLAEKILFSLVRKQVEDFSLPKQQLHTLGAPPALSVVGPRSGAGCWLLNKEHWHMKYL